MFSVFHLVYLMFQEGKGEVVPGKEPTLQSNENLAGKSVCRRLDQWLFLVPLTGGR